MAGSIEMRVVLSKLAKFEFEEAYNCYELELDGLGERFRREVKVAIRRILEYPVAWSIERGEIRRYLLYKFPYKILYSIEKQGEELFVVAIAHQHREPSYWVDKIEI